MSHINSIEHIIGIDNIAVESIYTLLDGIITFYDHINVV